MPESGKSSVELLEWRKLLEMRVFGALVGFGLAQCLELRNEE